jgi:hypothetical protein
VNFIIIVSDTFRYDYLGANGNLRSPLARHFVAALQWW